MEKNPRVKKNKEQIEVIIKDQKKKNGAEFDVYADGEERVLKVSRGVIFDTIENAALPPKEFDIEDVSENARKSFISKHILGKVLHILYPNNVPDVFNLKTKHYPRFNQDFIDGITEKDEVNFKVLELEKISNSKSKGNFVVNSRGQMVITGDEKLKTEKWENNIRSFEKKLEKLNISIDTKNENFLKTDNDDYMYIDTFSFQNTNNTYKKIKLEIEDRKNKKLITDKEFNKINILLKRFNKINKSDEK